jgi:hypothetical protein
MYVMMNIAVFNQNQILMLSGTILIFSMNTLYIYCVLLHCMNENTNTTTLSQLRHTYSLLDHYWFVMAQIPINTPTLSQLRYMHTYSLLDLYWFGTAQIPYYYFVTAKT